MTMRLVHKLSFVFLCLMWIGSQQASGLEMDSCPAQAMGASMSSPGPAMQACKNQSCRDTCESEGYWVDSESSDFGPSGCDSFDGAFGYWWSYGVCECDCTYLPQ